MSATQFVVMASALSLSFDIIDRRVFASRTEAVAYFLGACNGELHAYEMDATEEGDIEFTRSDDVLVTLEAR